MKDPKNGAGTGAPTSAIERLRKDRLMIRARSKIAAEAVKRLSPKSKQKM